MTHKVYLSTEEIKYLINACKHLNYSGQMIASPVSIEVFKKLKEQVE